MKLKINNLKDDDKIIWKKMTCTCKKGVVMEEHPVKICLHCKYQMCEDSMPRESFKVNDPILDKNGNATGKVNVREIKEISIIRGLHDEIVGWTF